jgi:hypothetical protein
MVHAQGGRESAVFAAGLSSGGSAISNVSVRHPGYRSAIYAGQTAGFPLKARGNDVTDAQLNASGPQPESA